MQVAAGTTDEAEVPLDTPLTAAADPTADPTADQAVLEPIPGSGSSDDTSDGTDVVDGGAARPGRDLRAG